MTAMVSIGMPVYNGEKYIREALDSLLSQTYTNFEMIISDNASIDNTQAICEEYASKDERIRYIRQKVNIGPINNFQFVLDESDCEFFMWAAHDDTKDRRFIELCVEVFNQNGDAGLVFSNMTVKNLKTNETTYVKCNYNSFNSRFFKYLFRIYNRCPSLIYGLYRTAIIKKFPIENFDYFDMHLSNWFEINSKIIVLPLALYTAGTDGNRVPYSLTDEYINDKLFYEKEYELLSDNFSWAVRCFLFLTLKRVINKNTKHVNRLIKSSK